MKKLWYVCMLLTVCLVGCNKTDDLWDDVNDLKTRVTALSGRYPMSSSRSENGSHSIRVQIPSIRF